MGSSFLLLCLRYMNLLTLKERRVRAQDRPLAPLPHHNGSRTSTFLPPALSPTNRQRSATILFTLLPRIGILRTSPFGHSRKLDFHFTEFSEVRIQRILGSPPVMTSAKPAPLFRR